LLQGTLLLIHPTSFVTEVTTQQIQVSLRPHIFGKSDAQNWIKSVNYPRHACPSVLTILESLNIFSATCDSWKFYCKVAFKTQTLRFSLTDCCSREVKEGLKRDASKGTRKPPHQVPFPPYVTFFLAKSVKKFPNFLCLTAIPIAGTETATHQSIHVCNSSCTAAELSDTLRGNCTWAAVTGS